VKERCGVLREGGYGKSGLKGEGKSAGGECDAHHRKRSAPQKKQGKRHRTSNDSHVILKGREMLRLILSSRRNQGKGE